MPPRRSESRNTAVVFRLLEYQEIYALAGPPRAFGTRIVSSRPLTPSTRAIEPEKPRGFPSRPPRFTFLQLKTEKGMAARPLSPPPNPTAPYLQNPVPPS